MKHNLSVRWLRAIATLLLCIGLYLHAPLPTLALTASSVYQTRPASRDGIGKVYLGREIAQVMGHLGAGWLERPSREREEQPQVLIDHLNLKPTDVVADIGAGTGYFSFRIAPLVPKGKVLAVDLSTGQKL
ncbi:class I SAM-dependent methyltransferase [Pantanalinema rosaneae CENA516]|uniref:class I SAM-dependent methyltransferase n=1 Tax=Pantanalinema rosaneae TaxID=1620701 RepID=UPI003D6DF7A8